MTLNIVLFRCNLKMSESKTNIWIQDDFIVVHFTYKKSQTWRIVYF